MYKNYKIISLCISRANDIRNFNYISALNKSFTERGWRVFIYHTCSDLYWDSKNENGEKTVFDLIDYNITDAVIVFDDAFYDKSVVNTIKKRAKENGVPVIIAGAFDPDCISFAMDYEYGFEQIVRHIVEYHGISDVHFMAGVKGEVNSEKRLGVIKKIMEENGLDFGDDRVSYGDYWTNPTKAAAEKLIESGLPRAIICANDVMAITVCTVLSEHGIKVPDDVIVTGFDGIDEAFICEPQLTTAKCSFEHAAEDMAEVISELFSGKIPSHEHSIRYMIDVRSSCGCLNEHEKLNTAELLKAANDRFFRYQDEERFLYEMSETLIGCKSIREFSNNIGKYGNYYFYATSVILNCDCFDSSVDPAEQRSVTFDDEMYLVYRSDVNQNSFPTRFHRNEIIPGIEDILENNNPVIFNALNYIGVPLGFMCYYCDVSMSDYCRIPQIVTSLNNSIGSYRNAKYQQYMVEYIKNIYMYDFLTGLLNRRGFFSEYKNFMASLQSSEHCGSITVASVDLDGLKEINDEYGHDNGDFAICSAAEALKSVPIERKLCARFGGDEFAICAVVDNAAEAEKVIRDAIKVYLDKINSSKKKPYTLSASVGVSFAGDEGNDFDTLLAAADKKMYAEKKIHKARNKSGS